MVNEDSISNSDPLEMFYLTTHSTHFISRLYGVRHMVKDHSDNERGHLLPPHRLQFNNQKTHKNKQTTTTHQAWDIQLVFITMARQLASFCFKAFYWFKYINESIINKIAVH